VVNISEGMEVPADCILIEANEITADESAMTGEPDPIPKNTYEQCKSKMKEIEECGNKNSSQKHDVPCPILFSGTKVLTGEGKMIVIAVGDSSCIGKIRVLAGQEEEDDTTPLQAKLEVLAGDIGKFGLISSVTILVILLIRFGV
jgi:magnesium-transporting ATPase (P-type)